MRTGIFKKLALAAVSCAAACAAAAAPSLAAFAEAEAVSYAGLGCAINVPCGGVYGEKPEGSVFDSAFLAERVKGAVPVVVRRTESAAKSFDEIEDVVNAYKTSLELKNGEALYKSSAAFLQSTIDYSAYPYRYYYYRYSDYAYCTLTLPEYKTRLGEYVTGLDAEYSAALDEYFGGAATAEELFRKYGTHVVMNGVFGKRWVSLCTAVSAVTDLSKYSSTLAQKAEKALNGSSFTLDKAGASVPVTEVSIAALCSPRAQTWDEFLKSGSVLTGAAADGLVPLWELLPEKWSGGQYSEKLEADYVSYAENYELDAVGLINSRPAAKPPETEPNAGDGETQPVGVVKKTHLNPTALALIGTGAALAVAGAAVLIVFAVLGRKNKTPDGGENKEDKDAGEDI